MQYFRMIGKKAQWIQYYNLNLESVCSDIVTNCLRTTDNTLSLWKVSSEEEIEKAVIALSSRRDNVQKFDYILIPEDIMDEIGLILKDSDGKSPLKSFNDKHCDIIELNYSKMGIVVKLIQDLLKNDENSIKRVHLSEVKKLLSDAISKEELDQNMLSDRLISDLGLSS